MVSFLKWASDGGKDSGVDGWWLIEWKSVFSIVLLKFQKGTREAYHSHAFHAITWFLWGHVEEQFPDNTSKEWGASLWPKWTPRHCVHRVNALETTYAISFRGPWSSTWHEINKERKTKTTFEHGRVVVDAQPLLE